MPCNLPKPERPRRVQELVLKYFDALAGRPVTLDTSLGPDEGGLGHLPVRRKFYHPDLKRILATSGCKMATLGPNDFGDTKMYATVGDIADMVVKDLGQITATDQKLMLVRSWNAA